jgi:hypothetical protein
MELAFSAVVIATRGSLDLKRLDEPGVRGMARPTLFGPRASVPQYAEARLSPWIPGFFCWSPSKEKPRRRGAHRGFGFLFGGNL